VGRSCPGTGFGDFGERRAAIEPLESTLLGDSAVAVGTALLAPRGHCRTIGAAGMKLLSLWPFGGHDRRPKRARPAALPEAWSHVQCIKPHLASLALISLRQNNGGGTTESRHSNKGENTMDLGLQDKHAIVTGGSRGIGKAIARELAREGADVAIVARNKADLEVTARELAAETNRRIVPLAADVTSKEQVDRMVAEAAQQLGGLHILVNSGSAPGGSATATGPIETVIDEDLLEDFNVKYVGALRCSRAVIPFMKTAGWGRIINISGGNARNAGNLSGGARNAGLVHMTKTLAVQLGRHGITVNCIHPGTTRTERTPSLLAARANQLGVSPEEGERQDFAPDSPRGNAICRMVDASEVAFVAVFLASEKAWAVSGELVAASGGAGRSVYY
jgi:NAD(P)-dependent dehydrogenase (short-subunit alcohol dehydrogenase family)